MWEQLLPIGFNTHPPPMQPPQNDASCLPCSLMRKKGRRGGGGPLFFYYPMCWKLLLFTSPPPLSSTLLSPRVPAFSVISNFDVKCQHFFCLFWLANSFVFFKPSLAGESTPRRLGEKFKPQLLLRRRRVTLPHTLPSLPFRNLLRG